MKNHSKEQISLSVTQAFDSIQQLVRPISEIERDVPLTQLLGRVLSADVISPINVPPHDNSAMDGYAFNSHCLNHPNPATGIVELTVLGKTLAGHAHHYAVQSHQCVQITTGAVIPQGCDTVIPVEFVTFVADRDAPHGSKICFSARSIHAGDNRRHKGEDITQGDIAIHAGTIVTPAAMGLLASLGLSTVPVWRRLKVAYFSTGDELLHVGNQPRDGAIYDSNRYTLIGMLSKLGIEMIDLGSDMHIIPDDLTRLEAALSLAVQQADVVITSGGVSVGEADHTKAVMKKRGDVEFWRIAIRPGRPMAVGTLKREDDSQCLLFGLPGNPVAVMVTFLALVRPALLKMMGNNGTPSAPMLQAKTCQAIHKKVGRTEYQRGIVRTNESGELIVLADNNQGSGILSSMTKANGLIVLDHDQSDVPAGSLVNVMMFEGAF